MPPIRPPDTRLDVGLPTRYQRRLQSRDARAYDRTNLVFNMLLPLFGRNRQMPLVYFRGQSPGRHPALDVQTEPVVPPAMAGHIGRRPAVVFPHGSVYAMDEPNTRQSWLDILVHELAHTQQGPKMWDERNPQSRQRNVEGGADAFALLNRTRVARRLGFGNPPTHYMGYGGVDSPWGQQFIRRYGRDYALHGQFSPQGWGR